MHPLTTPSPMAPWALPWQQPWRALQRGGTTPTYLPPTQQTPPTRLRMDHSSPPPRHITCTTPLLQAHTSSPWWQGAEAAVIHAPHQGSCRHAPTPPRAPPSCTPLCPIRTKEWVWRWSPATVAHRQTWQPLKPSGDLTDPAEVVEDTQWVRSFKVTGSCDGEHHRTRKYTAVWTEICERLCVIT